MVLRREAVERRRILYENAVTQCTRRRPRPEQVEQHRVVRPVVLIRVRPVAAPDEALRSRLHVQLRESGGRRAVAKIP